VAVRGLADADVGPVGDNAGVTSMLGSRSSGVAGVVERLAAVPGREDRLRHLEVLPPRPARHADWPDWADPEVVAGFGSRGVARPWQHQVVAAEAAHHGQHVVIATGTASGKSLG